MKTTRYILGLTTIVFLALGAGCSRENLAEPEPYHVWTKAEIEGQGYEFMSIEEFKKTYFYDIYGGDDGKGTYAVASTTIPETDKVAIMGKVTSTDQPGNLYKNLYLQDETGAIEIKIGYSGLYNDYKPGQILYVKCDNLVLGNYRYMLSIGGPYDNDDRKYSNSNLVLPKDIERCILRGEKGNIDYSRKSTTPGVIDRTADVLEVDQTNVAQLRDPEDLGRLVRFNGMESVWGTAVDSNGAMADGFSDTDIFPSFLQSTTVGTATTYANWYVQFRQANDGAYMKDGNGNYVGIPEGEEVADSNRYTYVWTNGSKLWDEVIADDDTEGQESLRPSHPTWAYKDWGRSYYGSSLFRMDNDAGGDKFYVIRSSGYSIFANVKLPEDGTKVDVVAFYNKYSTSSGGFKKFQLLVNSSNDVVWPGTSEPVTAYDRKDNNW